MRRRFHYRRCGDRGRWYTGFFSPATRLKKAASTRGGGYPLALGEVQRGGAFQFGLAHERRPALVPANGVKNGADVRRIAGAQFGAALAQTEFAEVFGAVGLAGDIELGDHA